jgi:hypothetical protein
MNTILLLLIIVCCCCLLVILAGGGYYFYTQSIENPKSSNKSEQITKSPSSQQSKPAEQVSSSSDTPKPSKPKEPEIDIKDKKEQDKYKIKDPEGIKEGKFKNIPNNTFGLGNELTRSTLTIYVKSDNYKETWQSIVGNMYNNAVQTGWGLWLNPTGYLHFRIEGSTWDLTDLGVLINKDPYLIILNYSYRTGYTFNLTNLKYFNEEGAKLQQDSKSAAEAAIQDNNPFALLANPILIIELKKGNRDYKKSATIDDKTRLISDKGFVTVGGWWENNQNEKFKGNINYLEFYKIM